jgi:hypothetical protein
MSPSFYHVLHVFSLATLLGYTFYAFAAGTETRKRVMMVTGISGLLMLVAGFGLISKMGYSFSSGWIWVKVVCWFLLMGIPGMAYRKREKANVLGIMALVLVLLALIMVYFKPF